MVTNEDSMSPGTEARASSAQRGLFVVWPRARHLQDRVIADLRNRFRISTVREIHWTPKLVTANFQRFYSDLDLRGVYHRLNKGDGPCLVVTVLDEAPVFDVRMTGRGRRRVLANFMDAKSLYRQWSGGIGIHCGETMWETERDLCMLFGPDNVGSSDSATKWWDGSTERLHRDLTGANGWGSISELFDVLNRAAKYVAIHYGDGELAEATEQHADIDILTDDYYAVHTILGSGRFMRPKLPNGGSVPIRIGRRLFNVGLRFPGDNYFDEAWSRRLLSTRVLDDRGYYRPADDETFWVLAYHELMHRRAPGKDRRKRLLSMTDSRGLSDWKRCFLEDEDKGRSRMVALLEERGITCPEPLDRTVTITATGQSAWPGLQYAVACWRNSISVFGQRLSSLAQAAYWPVRDGMLLRAPWLSKIKHWRRILT